MQTIRCHAGELVKVDDADFERLSKFRWHVSRSGYARRVTYPIPGSRHIVFRWMHREILGLEPGVKLDGDHINRDRLDNQRANLRAATRSQNLANKITKRNATGFRGVTKIPRNKNFSARITVNRRGIHLGMFPTAELAHAAYCEAARRLYGDFIPMT